MCHVRHTKHQQHTRQHLCHALIHDEQKNGERRCQMCGALPSGGQVRRAIDVNSRRLALNCRHWSRLVRKKTEKKTLTQTRLHSCPRWSRSHYAQQEGERARVAYASRGRRQPQQTMHVRNVWHSGGNCGLSGESQQCSTTPITPDLHTVELHYGGGTRRKACPLR